MGHLSKRQARNSIKSLFSISLKRYSKLRDLTPKQVLNTAVNTLETKLQLSRLHSLPQDVDIAVTKRCNLACIYCKDYTSSEKQVSLENFEKAARQLLPTARQVSICTGGEPYLYMGLEDLLRIVRRYKVPTWVLSNGMLLKEKRICTIVREELITQHGFSLDGIKASTVEAIRVNANLETILENVKMLIRIRKEEGKKTPRIIVRYVLMRSTIEELPDAVRHWGEIGIDQIDCNYLSLCNNIDRQQSLYFHQDLMERIFAEARNAAAHYPRLALNLPLAIRQQQSFQEKPLRCESPWNFVSVNTDGRVFPCYASVDVLNMGNVYIDGQSFRKLWNNPQYQALRRTANNDTVKKQYSYCSQCESRFGWGDLSVHLGDENWLKHLDLDEDEKSKIIAARRRKPKGK